MNDHNNNSNERSAFNMGDKQNASTGSTSSGSSPNLGSDNSKSNNDRDKKSETSRSVGQGGESRDVNSTNKLPEMSGDRR